MSIEAHQAAVSKVSSQVFSFYQRKVPFRLYHGSTNSTQARKVDPDLSVNKESKTCLVEPNVPMDKLMDATLPFGLVPPVVMEFLGITVGGGFAGTAGESSGFRYGFFDATVKWIEIVLPSGEVVNASSSERSDLFYGAAGTFGTLGVTTLFELQLIDAKRYVELTYHPTHGLEDALTTLQLAQQSEANDYVDGILFAKDRGVIVTGRLTDDLAPGTKVQPFSRARDPWFYFHADRTTRGSLEPVKEATPLKCYLFRYDRGAFWTGRYAFQYFITPFNRITRYVLDYFMHTRVMYHALHASGHASKYMIQDLLLPEETVGDFIEYLPERERKDSTYRTFVNVGVWGPASADFARFVEQNRELEHRVRELGGIKWLYAQAYYTEDEFNAIYDRQWYDSLRDKYEASHLYTVFEKVKVDLSRLDKQQETWTTWLQGVAWNVWPISGLYGVWKTLSERDNLLAK